MEACRAYFGGLEMRDQADTLRKMVRTQKMSNPRIIAITSGKGGVGKTNLSVNLSLALVEMGYRVALLDVDLGLANADIVLGVSPEYNLSHVLRGEKTIRDVIAEGPLGLKLLAGGSGVYDMANLNGWRLEAFANSIEQLNRDFDFVILDTGGGIHRNVLSFVLATSEVIVVTTPEPTAITDAYGIIKVIYQKNPDSQINLVVNMAHNPSEAELVADKLNSVLQQFINKRVNYLGYVLFDQHVSKAVADQLPVIMAYPSSITSRSIKRIARCLAGDDSPSGNGFKKFFNRVYDLLRI